MGTSVGGSHGKLRYPDFLPVSMQYVYILWKIKFSCYMPQIYNTFVYVRTR